MFEALTRDFGASGVREKYAERLAAEEARIARVTLAMAREGDYSRLIDAMGYRENEKLAVRALVACAAQGDATAAEAVDTLARTYASVHAEVD